MDLPAVPYVESATIEVDAHSDELAWASAVALPGSFITFQPSPGGTPVGTTRVRVLASADALYLYFECEDPEPSRIRAAVGRRDTRFQDDFVGLYLDPSGDSQRAYLFLVNPRGAQMDGIATGTGGEDISWDGAWQGAARITGQGWEAELAIPWRSVRHPQEAETMGFFLFRHVARLGEKSSWPVLDPAINGLLVQEGKLPGPGALPRTAGLDLVPEATAAYTDRGTIPRALSWQGLSAGLTARYSPSPSISLLGTVNPDFSQVESDTSQIGVNRRYALYFQEKRLFFLDGQEWFKHPFGELVYTRSIVTPLVGERATVELDGGTVAVLHAVDLSPNPSISEGGGWRPRDLRGHAANVLAVRGAADVGKDGQLGLVYSDRSVLGTDLANRVGGADFRVRLSENATATGSALGSWTTVAGSRPLLGAAGTAQVAVNGKHVYGGVWSQLISPGFRAENGYVPQADWVGGNAWLGTNFFPKSDLVPRGSITPLQTTVAFTTEGLPRELSLTSDASLVLGNGMQLGVGFGPRGERFAGAWLPSVAGWGWISGAPTSWLSLDASTTLGTSPYYDPLDPRVGWLDAVSGGVTLRPLPILSLSSSVGWERMLFLGEPLYDGFVTRERLDLNVTRSLFARLIADTSSFDGHERTELLMAWEQSPGTAVYLGGSSTFEEDPQWGLFAKVSGALRR